MVDFSLSEPNETKIQSVKMFFEKNPFTSLKNTSKKLKISLDELGVILHQKLQLHLHTVTLNQNRSNTHYQNKVTFAKNVCDLIEQKVIRKNKLWICDEAHFEIEGDVSKLNYRIWGTEKPHFIPKKLIPVEKITVWCAMSCDHIFGPIFINPLNPGGTLRITSIILGNIRYNSKLKYPN